jgi:predicted ATPase
MKKSEERNLKNQFIIENFRSWRGTNFFELNRVNLIFGSNSSGKSSILHAIALLKQSWRVGQFSSLANLQPKGTEIDLGRIEDQISKPIGGKQPDTIGFGLRFYEKLNIFQHVNEQRRMRPSFSSRGKAGATASFEAFDKLFPSPLDFRTKFTKDGKLRSVEFRSAGQLVLGLEIKHSKTRNQLSFVCDEEAMYWDRAIDWAAMVEVDDAIPSEFEARRSSMAQKIEDYQEKYNKIRKNIIVSKRNYGNTRIDELQSESRSLTFRISRMKSDLISLESEFSKPYFVGSSIADTKKAFFKIFGEPFSLPVQAQSGSTINLAPVLDPYYLSRWRYLSANRLRKVQGGDDVPAPLQSLEACLRYLVDGCVGPTEIVQALITLFCRFVESSERIGPHRERPDRITFVNPGDRVSRVGSQGENVVPIIYKAEPSDIRLINGWLEKLEIDYSIKRRFTKRYNIAELRLIDADHHEISLSDVGYGVGQILPVLLSAILQKDALICIEQPELHLHPRLQANLIDLFLWSAEERNNVFILETHSEHIVLRMQRRQRERWEAQQPVKGSDGQLRSRPSRRTRTSTEAFAAPWKSLPASVSMQIVTLEDVPRRSVISSVALNSEGEFKDVWPGDFFPERFIEKGLI